MVRSRSSGPIHTHHTRRAKNLKSLNTQANKQNDEARYRQQRHDARRPEHTRDPALLQRNSHFLRSPVHLAEHPSPIVIHEPEWLNTNRSPRPCVVSFAHNANILRRGLTKNRKPMGDCESGNRKQVSVLGRRPAGDVGPRTQRQNTAVVYRQQ